MDEVNSLSKEDIDKIESEAKSSAEATFKSANDRNGANKMKLKKTFIQLTGLRTLYQNHKDYE